MNVETKLLLCLKRSDKCIITLVWFDLNTFLYMCSCRTICLAHQPLGAAGGQFHWVSPFASKEKFINSSFPPAAPPNQREAGSHTSSIVLRCPGLSRQAHIALYHLSQVPLCYSILGVLSLAVSLPQICKANYLNIGIQNTCLYKEGNYGKSLKEVWRASVSLQVILAAI